jgi:hypothetical protein
VVGALSADILGSLMDHQPKVIITDVLTDTGVMIGNFHPAWFSFGNGPGGKFATCYQIAC